MEYGPHSTLYNWKQGLSEIKAGSALIFWFYPPISLPLSIYILWIVSLLHETISTESTKRETGL